MVKILYTIMITFSWPFMALTAQNNTRALTVFVQQLIYAWEFDV